MFGPGAVVLQALPSLLVTDATRSSPSTFHWLGEQPPMTGVDPFSVKRTRISRVVRVCAKVKTGATRSISLASEAPVPGLPAPSVACATAVKLLAPAAKAGFTRPLKVQPFLVTGTVTIWPLSVRSSTKSRAASQLPVVDASR